ncbi:MAG: hypothetical protein QNK05_03460 [Myxococcota bacterium]|nr:hypothetical protein [Myxococcota bacterium]
MQKMVEADARERAQTDPDPDTDTNPDLDPDPDTSTNRETAPQSPLAAPTKPGPAGGAGDAPDADPVAGLEALEGRTALERLASFRFTYIAIFLFVVAYIFTIEGLERALWMDFQARVVEATQVPPDVANPAQEIQNRIGAVKRDSIWPGLGVSVRPIVLGRDGLTLLYAGSRPPPASIDPVPAADLLPALVDVDVTVSHNTLLANGILLLYGSLLITTLYLYTRRLTTRAEARIEEVTRARDAGRERAQSIEGELRAVRDRLATVEPENESFAGEIQGLRDERARLRDALASLEHRERELMAQSSEARDSLESERRALEELLEEAVHDVEQRDEEIRSLQKLAKRAGREKGKDEEIWSRRLRTLYRDLEVDERAISDLAGLGDESLRLKAEEALKRLHDEPEGAAVRRKLGGLPTHLSIFELGFAGKGRIYYTRGQSRRHRILLIGGKNSQKPDLEYLSRLPKGT